MREFTEGWQSPGNALHWDVVSGSNELWVPDPRQVNPEEDGVRVCDVDMWTSDFFGEAMFNWMGWNRPKWDRNV